MESTSIPGGGDVVVAGELKSRQRPTRIHIDTNAGGKSGRASDREDEESLSPPMRMMRKMGRRASTVAMAITESHESDGEPTGSDSDEDVTEIGALDKNLDGLDLQEDIASNGDSATASSQSIHRSPKKQLPSSSRFGIPGTGLFDKLETIDRRISEPIFRLHSGKLFESLMLIFGTWFGLPLPAWGLWTSFLALLDEMPRLEPEVLERTTVLVGLAFVLYAFNFIKWVRTRNYHRVYGNLKQLAAIPILFYVSFGYGTASEGYNTGAFFVVTWVVAETVAHVLKYWHHRLRPVAYLDLSDTYRHFPEVQNMFKKGHTAIESFPSADTIGGAIFSCTLYTAGHLPLWAAFTLSICIAFSRVYLQAHHVGDVTVGHMLGWGTAYQMWTVYGAQRTLGPWHAISATIFFVVFALIARKFKTELPPHMIRPKSLYGF